MWPHGDGVWFVPSLGAARRFHTFARLDSVGIKMMKHQYSELLTLAKGGATSLGGTATGRLLVFLSQVIVARFLGAEVFGVFVLAVVAVKLAELIARLGLDTACMRFVSIFRKDHPAKLKGTLISSIVIAFVSGLVVAAILFAGAGFLSDKVFEQSQLTNIIRLLCTCIPFMASMRVIAIGSQGFHTTRYSVYTKDFVQPLANIILVIVFLLLGAGLRGVVYAFLLSHIAAVTAGMYLLISRGFLDVRGSQPSEFDITGLFHYSIPLLVSGVLSFVMVWTDSIMLGIMGSTADVGIYRAAAQIPLLMVLILEASNSIYAPVSADLFGRGEIGRLGLVLKTTTRWVFTLALPAAIVLVFSAGHLMLLFGTEFVNPGAAVLVILAGAQLVNCVTGGVGYTLIMTGRQNVQTVNSIVMLLVNVALNIVLIPRLGAVGAALATGVTLAAMNIVRLVEVYAFYAIHPYNRSYLPVVAAGLVAAGVLVFFHRFLTPASSVLVVLVNLLVVAVVFAAVLGFAGLLDEDRYVLAAFKSKLRSLKPAGGN